MGCYYVAFMFACIQPLLISWCNLNASGTTKRVTTTAIMFGALTIGNVVGPQVYLDREKPTYFTGLYVDIACWCVEFILICVMGQYLRILNKRQEQKRREMGLPENIKDTSIMTTSEAEAYRIELQQTMIAQGIDQRVLEDALALAFEDLTDKKNPMFQYVV